MYTTAIACYHALKVCFQRGVGGDLLVPPPPALFQQQGGQGLGEAKVSDQLQHKTNNDPSPSTNRFKDLFILC